MRAIALIGVLTVGLTVSGCESTSRARSVEETGFLGAETTALLRPGGGKEAQLRYVRPGVDWASYRNVLLDPVTLWRGQESAADEVSAKDAQALTDYFYSVIRQSLQKQGIKLVSAPEPHTLRVKVAIVKPREANVAMDVVSTVIPTLHALSSLDKLTTGKPAFVGEAQVEVKVTDALTGELLGAGIDHRVGGNVLNSSTLKSWGQVEEMMRLWAAGSSYNLCRMQDRAGCIAPPQ